ncbi:MAG: FAD/NAD(P)-binding protein [Bacillota bacterium]
MPDLLKPNLATVTKITSETAANDVKTFKGVFQDPGVAADFAYASGQCAMVSVLGVGECMISITSTPTRAGFLEFSIKRTGRVTDALHELNEGETIGVRGPYGNSFPLGLMAGKDLRFIGGGIGLAPLRSLINNVLDNRERYGEIDIIYGARSPGDLVFKEELFTNWQGLPRTKVHLTVDKGDATWTGPVGFVPSFLEQLAPTPAGAIAITCGPPIMIKFVLQNLAKLGYTDAQVVTTLEMKMQCGVGKCGRCNIGDKYVCVDGPVFTLSQLKALPAEF